MSEVTTGSIPIKSINLPRAICTTCITAAQLAVKYCAKKYETMLQNIEQANNKLQWLDKTVVTSPRQMAKEALRLKNLVSTNNSFLQMTEGMNNAQKEILAGAIATQHSPLKAYVPNILSQLPEGKNVFEEALSKGVKNFAFENFKYVNTVVKDAAIATGFVGGIVTLKQTDTMFDVVFNQKEHPQKKLTAYCKLDNELNPSLALDLEGFDCDSRECTEVMNKLVEYLQNHGVPFNPTRIKHNQPMGVLREMLNKKKLESKKLNDDYLTNRNCINNNSSNQKSSL